MRTPYIETWKSTKTLMVKEEPFIAYAGEVHNSNCSSIQSFKDEVLQNIDQLPLNTLLLPVYWELIEEEEGIFQFELIQELLEEVRKHKLHVILLWFGLWKNGMSTYVPTWMKKDRERYPFIQKQDGTYVYAITPLCEEAIQKDAIAFSELMKFLYTFDHEEQTVVMVQVENEVGVLGSARDYAPCASAIFSKPIPQEVSSYMNRMGTWKEVFGTRSEESFMAYFYAKAIETIAKAGKQQYDLPMLVNTWLKKTYEQPGDYPSGGPNQEQFEFYRSLAPSIDVCAPDIYVENFKEICDIYAKQNLLLVPETRQDRASISHCIYAMAAYPMICYAPFGIEDFQKVAQGENQADVLKILGITKEAFQPVGSLSPIQMIYQDLQTLTPLLLEFRGTNRMYPFLKQKEEKYQIFQIQDILVTVSYLKKEKQQLESAGFIIDMGSYWLAYGVEFMLSLSHATKQVGILIYEEGTWCQGTWNRKRTLNGDERYQIWVGDKPTMLKIALHTY